MELPVPNSATELTGITYTALPSPPLRKKYQPANAAVPSASSAAIIINVLFFAFDCMIKASVFLYSGTCPSDAASGACPLFYVCIWCSAVALTMQVFQLFLHGFPGSGSVGSHPLLGLDVSI